LYIHTRTVSDSVELESQRTLAADFRRAQLFECLPVACYACDRDGIITDYNHRVIEIWGRAPQKDDRFTGAYRIWDSSGDQLSAEATATAFLLRSGLAQINKELVIEKPDGKRITVLSNVAPLLNDEGRIIGALDVLQDITDRQWREDARRVGERLSASARIATQVTQLKPALLSLGNLLDRLGHESTLSVEARGYAELARTELVRFDALVKHMAHLAGAA